MRAGKGEDDGVLRGSIDGRRGEDEATLADRDGDLGLDTLITKVSLGVRSR